MGQTAQLNIPLSLGSETETITENVENAATLDSETSNLDYTVQSKQANDLPLNGRNPYGLAVLAPGNVPGANFGVGVAVARGAVVAAATNNFQSNGGIGGNNEILSMPSPSSSAARASPPSHLRSNTSTNSRSSPLPRLPSTDAPVAPFSTSSPRAEPTPSTATSTTSFATTS